MHACVHGALTRCDRLAGAQHTYPTQDDFPDHGEHHEHTNGHEEEEDAAAARYDHEGGGEAHGHGEDGLNAELVGLEEKKHLGKGDGVPLHGEKPNPAL